MIWIIILAWLAGEVLTGWITQRLWFREPLRDITTLGIILCIVLWPVGLFKLWIESLPSPPDIEFFVWQPFKKRGAK